MYDSSLKAKWDYENSMAYAEEKAEERGKYEGVVAIARAMKKDGIPFPQIPKFTKLSIDEIEKL